MYIHAYVHTDLCTYPHTYLLTRIQACTHTSRLRDWSLWRRCQARGSDLNFDLEFATVGLSGFGVRGSEG